MLSTMTQAVLDKEWSTADLIEPRVVFSAKDEE